MSDELNGHVTNGSGPASGEESRPGSLIRGYDAIQASGITVEELFSVLDNRRRRDVIRCLRREDDGMTVRDLCEQIAAWENDSTPADLDYQERKRVYTSLYQNHLPKMVDVGVVEHDEEADVVRLTDAVRDLSIEFVSGPPRSAPRSRVVVGLAIAAVVGTAGVALSLPPIDAVQPVVILAVVTVLVAGTAATALT
jgi:hypothetical protein